MTFRQWVFVAFEDDLSNKVDSKVMEEYEAGYQYYCTVNGYFPIWDN